MTGTLVLLSAVAAGAVLGVSWVSLDLGAMQVGTGVKVLLWALAGSLFLGGVRRVARTSALLDVAWIVIFASSAFAALLLSGIWLGLGGIR